MMAFDMLVGFIMRRHAKLKFLKNSNMHKASMIKCVTQLENNDKRWTSLAKAIV